MRSRKPYIGWLRSGARVIYNSENCGFPVAANQGIRVAKGQNIVLVNNDTMVTTGWLRRLLHALDSDPGIGLAGPCSNCVSGAQEVPVRYPDLVEQIGVLDERFEIGCFEDDDFCLRAIQAGWRAVIAREAFIHHFGSRTFVASGVDFSPIIRENGLKFVEKWTTLQSADGSADAAPPLVIPSRPPHPGG